MSSIYPTYEILGSLMSQNLGTEAGEFEADPKTYIADKFGVNLGETNIAVANNEQGMVNLALPYYDALESFAVKSLGDELENVQGGEFFLTIVTVICLTGVGAAGIGAAAGLGNYFTKKNEDRK